MAVQVSNLGPAGELRHDQINGDLERALEPPDGFATAIPSW